MRLLFIYFYENKGPFPKGTIIQFSKKYHISQSKKNEFNFNMKKNQNFDENFYSNNIDIGVIIGENGSGKSILVNSIRDKNNNYSLIVFESNEGNFYISKDELKVHINDKLLKNKRDFEYIYYCPIIDIFDDDLNPKYNISNRKLMKDAEDKGCDLNSALKEIENDDLKKYFKYNRNNNVSINSLKLKASDVFFDQFYYDIEKNAIELFKIMTADFDKRVFLKIIDCSNSNFLKHIINEEIYNSYMEFEKLYAIFENDFKLCKKYFKSLEYLINKKFFRPSLFEYEDLIKESFILITKELNENKMERVISHDGSFDKYYLEKFFKNQVSEILESSTQIFLDYLKSTPQGNYEKVFSELENNSEFLLFIKIIYLLELFNYILGYLDRNSLFERRGYNFINIRLLNREKRSFKESVEMFLLPRLFVRIHNLLKLEKIHFYNFKLEDYKKIVNSLVEDNLIENYNNFYNINDKQIQTVVNSLIENYTYEVINNKKINLELKKIVFVNSFYKLFDNQNEYKKLILVLNLLKVFMKVNDTEELVDFFDKNSKKNIEEYFIIEEFDNEFINKIDENCIIYLDENIDVFFKYNKKLLEYEFDFFELELNPPLSSGQKAILFIFARINDAIQNIDSSKDIIIILDEADLKLHLEWQRKLVYDLINFLNSYSNNFYILYATHSPMILSDITDDRVVFLKKEKKRIIENDKEVEIEYSENISTNINNKKRTFGANIYDLYHDSFFMEQFMGEFAQNKINELIDIINLYKIIEEFEKTRANSKMILKFIKPIINKYNLKKIISTYRKRYYKENRIKSDTWKDISFEIFIKVYDDKKYLDKVKNDIIKSKEIIQNTIEFIGEPILRNELLDLVKIIGDEDNIQDIIDKLRDLPSEEIENELIKYDREQQIEIWKKLYKIKDSQW
ncbi:OLD family protein [Halarcobacter anaerophilus]|uniref:ATPase AAA-type core domain-containing protein n=1 Tax=Halarcobacter anaerophilus TaxID=877500 RepID=A0A4V1LQA9_9BACT|nr:hypothetical protein [Halarcobacter anaerophilus]QDF27714.1 hypothetical protein AANAER_0204 [Halarcobacter anaerophilus]RXJ64058.1 hypothetical protein CRV06_03720 [Halarcobacter anaerophilus]